MKKIFSIIASVVLITILGCSQTSEKSSDNKSNSSISFETTEHDFGSIPYKGNGTYEFVFKNTGKEPIVLRNVRTSCGCTIPEWPKDPIKKGERGIIKISYNTRLTGNFSKMISVYSNATTEPVILKIKGKVEAAPQEVANKGSEE